MNLKSLFIAGAAALTLGLSAMSSSAKADVFIGFGLGGSDYCQSHYDRRCRGFNRFDRFYGYERYDLFYRMTCKEARWMLDERGYNRVKPRACGARYHVFSAIRKGLKVLVKVSAQNGRIVSVNRF
jgi:hypothetical protein